MHFVGTTIGYIHLLLSSAMLISWSSEPPWLNILRILSEKYKLWSSQLCNFLSFPVSYVIAVWGRYLFLKTRNPSGSDWKSILCTYTKQQVELHRVFQNKVIASFSLFVYFKQWLKLEWLQYLLWALPFYSTSSWMWKTLKTLQILQLPVNCKYKKAKQSVCSETSHIYLNY